MAILFKTIYNIVKPLLVFLCFSATAVGKTPTTFSNYSLSAPLDYFDRIFIEDYHSSQIPFQYLVQMLNSTTWQGRIDLILELASPHVDYVAYLPHAEEGNPYWEIIRDNIAYHMAYVAPTYEEAKLAANTLVQVLIKKKRQLALYGACGYPIGVDEPSHSPFTYPSIQYFHDIAFRIKNSQNSKLIVFGGGFHSFLLGKEYNPGAEKKFNRVGRFKKINGTAFLLSANMSCSLTDAVVTFSGKKMWKEENRRTWRIAYPHNVMLNRRSRTKGLIDYGIPDNTGMHFSSRNCSIGMGPTFFIDPFNQDDINWTRVNESLSQFPRKSELADHSFWGRLKNYWRHQEL